MNTQLRDMEENHLEFQSKFSLRTKDGYTRTPPPHPQVWLKHQSLIDPGILDQSNQLTKGMQWTRGQTCENMHDFKNHKVVKSGSTTETGILMGEGRPKATTWCPEPPSVNFDLQLPRWHYKAV